MSHAIRKFLSNEERAGTVVIGGVTLVATVSFVLAVSAMLLMK